MDNRITDPYGAAIFTEALRDDAYRVVGYELFIKPAGENHRRPLARFIHDLDALIVERDSSAPIHVKHGGYHVNRFILHEKPGGPEVAQRLIIVEVDLGKVYVIPLLTFAREAGPQKMARTGLATQVFMDRDWITHYEATGPHIRGQVKIYSPGFAKWAQMR